jgi:hypothetical protein
MAESALRNLQRERMNERRARIGMEPFVPQAPTKTAGQAMADMLGGMAVPLSAVPVAGDIAGLAADAAMYATRPDERTLGNAALTLAGVLPFVPGASTARAAERALDMSQAARMQRATELGFDVDNVFYHGSGESFDEFDPLKMGKTDEGWFGKGFYFSPNPEIANQYAAGRSPNVQQVYLRAKNPYDWRKNEGVGMRLGTPEERYAKTREIMSKGYDSVDVYSDRIKLSPDQALSDDVFLAIVKRSQEMGDPVIPRTMIEQALKSGIEYSDFARHYGNDIASMMPVKRTLTERVVFDPTNIRSINATFDPAKRNSANLMAGIDVSPVGVSALRALIPQENQE